MACRKLTEYASTCQWFLNWQLLCLLVPESVLVHLVVFAGFSANALADRINDSSCKVLLTSDGQYRGNKEINIKHIADDALLKTESITSVIVYKRTKQDCTMHKGRDYWWHDEMELSDVVCPAETMDAEDMLFILYTSGSTGRLKRCCTYLCWIHDIHLVHFYQSILT